MENKAGKIYVSQKVILLDQKGKILAIRRTKTAPSRPLYWDLPGGQLEIGEDLEPALAREIKEEVGLSVQNIQVLDVVADFDDKKEFWITICYTAHPESKQVVLSYEHDDYQWVTPNEFLKLEISSSIQKFIEQFQSLRKTLGNGVSKCGKFYGK